MQVGDAVPVGRGGASRTRRWPAGVPGDFVMLATTGAGLACGGLIRAAGQVDAAHLVWALTTAGAIIPATWWVVAAARRRQLGVDVLALLALVGTLLVGEYLAGAIIAVMLASGRSLEAWAAGRATRDLHKLVERAPRTAHLRTGDEVTDVPVGEVAVGDLLLVKPGDVVPVDGRLRSAGAVVDESALTGEPLPVERVTGDEIRSGAVNVGGPLDMRATTVAGESTYAGIVKLVEAAQSEAAPAVRLADRYAVWFLAVSLAVATVAGLVSGELSRAVAVLVVATPCPLILGVPVALVSGLSLTARRGVIVKGGGVLERLAGTRVLLFDKTGTLTVGQPVLVDVVTGPGPGPGPGGAGGGHGAGFGDGAGAGDGAGVGSEAAEALRLAASLDQVSPHVLAAAVVRAAADRRLPLTLPHGVEEVAGQGVRGQVGDHRVAVGKRAWIGGPDPGWLAAVRRRADRDGRLTVFVGVDGEPVAALLFADEIRTDAARTIRRLRQDGVQRILMVTGDRSDVADTVGAVLGVDEVLAERTPEEKLEAVAAARAEGPTVMVGDGINDAPALASADVGVAIGARGATASSEAADVVLGVDRLDRVGEAIVIARRSLRLATESVLVGIGLSLAAMAVAAAGLLPATWGAITQEAIDVAVILNALRALAPVPAARGLAGPDAALTNRFAAEHRTLRPELERVRAAADAVGTRPDAEAVALADATHRWLTQELLPHEQAEDDQLYPMLARVLGGTNRTATMSRAHVEIAHLVRRLGQVLDDLRARFDDQDLAELRRLLYGLHAVLRLHFAQEDESYLSLAEDTSGPVAGSAPPASGAAPGQGASGAAPAQGDAARAAARRTSG